ncbi:MAG TPA: hypothetical protein VHI13_05505 [Candidatus Kapabacteria bacterium]|nr:hypothetical protein [Candidatus Kapabacteria bacterium]
MPRTHPCTTAVLQVTCTLDLTFYDGSGNMFTINNIIPGTGPYTAPPFVAVGIVSALGAQVPVPGQNMCTACVTLHVTSSSSTCCVKFCETGVCKIGIDPVTPCPGDCQ